jgi:hypothetical protein
VTALGGGGKDNGTASSKTTLVGSGEIFLEPVADAGADPFTDSVSTAETSTTTSTTATTASTTTTTAAPGTSVGIQGVTGGRPGLYGGTRNMATCDKEKLIEFLETNTSKGAAWAKVQGIDPSEIHSFIDGLTPVILDSDTRVTNHGYKNGVATAHQSVLQAGTAVLVDAYGGPRAKCFCGNPLLPPEAMSAPTYVGQAWPEFSPANVTVVVPEKTPIVIIVLVDTSTGASFARPVGTDGAEDADPEDVVVSSSTSAPTTTEVVVGGLDSDIPEPNAFVQSEVLLSPESEYSDQYPAANAVDGDPGTSWFSKGDADGPSTNYNFVLRDPELITLIRITGNGQNTDPATRTGFGFESVTITVLDEDGGIDFTQTVDLSGTPDPTVEVRPGVTDRFVNLIFNGHEDPGCGGFSELEVGVTR